MLIRDENISGFLFTEYNPSLNRKPFLFKKKNLESQEGGSAPSQHSTLTSLSTMSLATQTVSGTSCDDLMSQLSLGGICPPKETVQPHPPDSLTILRAPSDVSDIDPPVAASQPIVNFPTAPPALATLRKTSKTTSLLLCSREESMIRHQSGGCQVVPIPIKHLC